MDTLICVLAFLLAFLGGIATIYLIVTTTRNLFLAGCYNKVHMNWKLVWGIVVFWSIFQMFCYIANKKKKRARDTEAYYDNYYQQRLMLERSFKIGRDLLYRDR